jgi:hypothetical protein
MLALLPFLLLIGLFLPGFFIARCLRHSLWPASAFVISLLILFHCVFWLGVFGVSIKLWTVLPLLVGVTGLAAWMQRRFPPTAQTQPKKTPWSREERILLWLSALVGIVLLVHSARSPMAGQDSRFRWDFLAQRLLDLGTFNYYPPLHTADFRNYFYVDGIPPLVSFTNWWLYASAGEHLPVLICLRVAAEFFGTLAFTYGTASALFSRRAGVLAAAILAASPLYFRAVFLGQETGLTALSIASMLYFIVTARMQDWPAMVSAGLAAALCALSREYGGVALIGGAVALLWRRQAWKQILVFAAVGAAVAAPWYLRNWILAGNPVYSLRLAGFAVNPIHDAMLQFYKADTGVQTWSAGNWVSVFVLVLVMALPQVLAGIPGGFLYFRGHGYLIVMALLLAGLWILSVGYTSGGVEISLRVLSPALVALSITGAGALEALMRRARWRWAVVIAIGACQFWNASQGMLFPFNPLSLPPAQWLSNAFQPTLPPAEFQLRDPFIRILPRGYRVLSDSAYLHAALLDAGIEVVPVWSPEVRFLFSSPPEESERRLAELHIGSVVLAPRTLNGAYLASASPFYASLPQRWRVLAQTRDSLYILVPKAQ